MENDTWLHSDYDLLDLRGQQLQRVRNQSDHLTVDPAIVRLVPGRYAIVARSAAGRQTTVPVVIEEDRTTHVHLDGTPMPDTADSDPDRLVRDPDGLTVGWRAADAIRN
jgi:hypothetical protein